MQSRTLVRLGCALLSVALAACGGGGSSSGGGTSSGSNGSSNTGNPGSGNNTQEPTSFTISSNAGPGTAILIRDPIVTEGESSFLGFFLATGYSHMEISGDCLPPLSSNISEASQRSLQTLPITKDCTVNARAEVSESEESYWTSLHIWPSVIYAHEITEGTEIEISVQIGGTTGLLNNEPATIAKVTASASTNEGSGHLIGNNQNGWLTVLERASLDDATGAVNLYKGVMRPKSMFRDGQRTGSVDAGNGQPIIYSDDYRYDGAQSIYISIQLWDAFGNQLQPYNSPYQAGDPRRGFLSQPLIVLDNHIPRTSPIAQIDGIDVYDHFIHIREDGIHLVDSDTYIVQRILQLVNHSSSKSDSAFGQPTILELALETPCVWDCWPHFRHARSTALNTGRPPRDDSVQYGNNPNLRGLIFSQPFGRSGNVVVHEIGHTFSAYLDDPRLSLASGGHWKTWADVPMGVMDASRGLGSGLMSRTPDGTWKPANLNPRPPLLEKRAYSMLDLYLAGMAYPHEVPGFHILLKDFESPDSLQDLGYVDINRITSVYGERSPPYDGKPVDLTMLTIVVTSRELPPAVAAFYNHRNKFLMGKHHYDSAPYATVVSVPDACRGRCTFSTKVPNP